MMGIASLHPPYDTDIGLAAVKKLAICVVVLLPLIILAWVIGRYMNLNAGFARIERGNSPADVIRIMGEPNNVAECGRSGGTPAPGCVKEFSYLSVLVFTDLWVVSFDADDKVLRKARLSSP